jgi:hypothetical protein
MTGMFNSRPQNRRSAFERGIGLLLLGLIFYGTTVEAAHRHGRIPAENGPTSLLESEHSSTPVGGKTGCSDCLICQLHQSFTTTLIAFRLLDPPGQIQLPAITAIPPDVLSQLTGPTSGRAPPFIS